MKISSTIRSYQRQPEGPRPLQRLSPDSIQPQNRWKPRRVEKGRLEEEVQRLEADNLKLSKNLKRGLLARGDRVLPKDSSVNPSHMLMAHNTEDGLSPRFIAQMAEIGALEGFHVLARCTRGETADLREQLNQWPGKRHVTVIPLPGDQDVWTEDQGEFTLRGNLVLPPLLDRNTSFGQIAFLGRLERLHPEANAAEIALNLSDFNLQHAMSQYPRANFSYQGMVGQAETHLGLLAGSLALDVPETQMAVSYIEGGNFLPGSRADGTPVAFVGRDSVAISQKILEQDLGRRPSEAEVLGRVARDYGLKPGQVLPVEQPADFHVDMAMTWTRPGHVILNDSQAVLEMQKGWLQKKQLEEIEKTPEQAETIRQRYQAEVTRLEQLAEHQADLEALSFQDLQQAGVEVDRLAGAFPASLANPAMNFLNLRQGTAEDGTTFAVMLGGTPEAEDYVRQQLLQELPTGYQRLHFLDPALTGPTLELWGGIKCRTKPIAVDCAV